MKAYILAAGEGQRLRPLTYGTPKILMHVKAIPILEWILNPLSKCSEIDEAYVIIRAGDVYEPAIRNYISHRKEYTSSNLEVSIAYGLGWETGGDLSLVLRDLDNKKLLDKSEDLIVTYGDLVSDPDINKLLSRHKEAKNKLGAWTTVMLFEVPKQEARRFGVAWVKSITEDLFLVEKFVEKPTTEELPEKTYVNAGFMIIGKEVYHNLDRYLPAKKSRLEHTILQALPETKELAGCLHDFKIWADIGTIEALEEINEKIYTGKVIIPPPPIQRNMTDIV